MVDQTAGPQSSLQNKHKVIFNVFALLKFHQRVAAAAESRDLQHRLNTEETRLSINRLVLTEMSRFVDDPPAQETCPQTLLLVSMTQITRSIDPQTSLFPPSASSLYILTHFLPFPTFHHFFTHTQPPFFPLRFPLSSFKG